MLDELNRLGFGYRWVTRFLCLDKAERELTRLRRQWFAKRKSVVALLRETIFQQESPPVDSDAANQAMDADAALQELGSDTVAFGYVTMTVVVSDPDLEAVGRAGDERAAERGSCEAGAAREARAGGPAQPAHAGGAGRWIGDRDRAGDLVGVPSPEAARRSRAGDTERRAGDAGRGPAAAAERLPAGTGAGASGGRSRAAPGSTDAPEPPDQAASAEQQRLQSEMEAAAKAQVFFQTGQAARAAAAASAATVDPVPPGVPSMLPATPTPAADDYAQQNRQADKQAFVDAKPDSRIYGIAELQIPRSPYQLMAGTVIPAALLTAVNSDLPGQVIATLTEHVFDTLTGRHLLIPQGSRLLGEYDSQVAYGQRRVLLVWTRLIRPDDGSSLMLDRLPATDAAGQAGLEDKVDWHWRRIVASAALSTLLGVGAELAAPDRVDAEGRIVIATRESVHETVNQVGQQITRRNLDLQPTLTIRPGYPLRIVVSRDLVLPTAMGD